MRALKVGVLFYAQVGEPLQFLAEPPLVGSGRDFQHGGDSPGLVGVHWQVRDSGDQRDVAAEVMAVDPGPYYREVLCGNQQIAGQGRMIVKMARSHPRCSGGMSSSSPM